MADPNAPKGRDDADPNARVADGALVLGSIAAASVRGAMVDALGSCAMPAILSEERIGLRGRAISTVFGPDNNKD